MIKVKHFTNAQLGQMVGNQLGSKLWLNGMMNEIRRYANEIPCDRNEIPSMILPFASGEEKVEWGFTAGMSCLSPDADGVIAVRNAEHFPACAVLALLSLLFDAGAGEGKQITVTLRYTENPEMKNFWDLLKEAEQKLPNVTIRRSGDLPQEKQGPKPQRKLFPIGNSICVVRELHQTDVARFLATVRCIDGGLRVRDDLTVTDSNWNVLQEHCPVIAIGSGNRTVNDSNDLGDDDFSVYYAMWFPPNTPALDGMVLVREQNTPVFTPREMPAAVTITASKKESWLDKIKSRFKKS